MVGFFPAGSRKSQGLARLAGVLCLAVLLSLFSLFTPARPAHASGGIGFLDRSTASNTFGDSTLIGVTDPNDPILVTAAWNPFPSTPFDNHQLGVWYDGAAGQWAIFNEDGASMPVGALFDVYSQLEGIGSVQTASAVNTSGYIMTLNLSGLNGDPAAILQVTQNWNPGGRGGIYNPHAIGVWYDPFTQRWTIYNEDRSALPLGASFNLFFDTTTSAPSEAKVVATASNTQGNVTCFGALEGADWPITVTHLYSGYFTDVIGVAWDSSQSEWCLFDAAGNAVSSGDTFFVIAL